MALKFVQTGNLGSGGAGGGTYDHNLLVNRGMPDQHTIESVTGLRDALARKYEKPFSGIPKTDLAFDVATLHDLNIFRNTELADVINDLTAIAFEVETARGGLDTLKEYIDTKVPYSEWTGTGGGTGGGHVDSQVGYPLYEEYRAAEGQITFPLTKTYQMGTHQLEVYLNGLRMVQNDDYIEKDDHTIEFLFPLEDQDLALFMVRAVINSGLHEEYVAIEGQTDFTLSSPYGIYQNILQVYRNGVLKRKGRDYREVDDKTIQFMYPLKVDDFIVFHQAGATDPIAGTILESEIGRIKINHGYTTMSLHDAANLSMTDYLDMYIDTFITDASLDRENSYPFLYENQSVEVGNATFDLVDKEDFLKGTPFDVDIETYPGEIILKNLPGGAETHSFSPYQLQTGASLLHETLAFVNNHHEEFLFYSEELPSGQTVLRVQTGGQAIDLNTTDGYFFALSAEQDSKGNIHLVYHEQGSAAGTSRVQYLVFDREQKLAGSHLIVSDTLSDAIKPDVSIDTKDIAHIVFASKRVASVFNIDYRTIDQGVMSGFVDVTIYTTSDALNPRIAVGTDDKARIVFESITLDGATKNIRYILLNGGVRENALWITNATTFDNVQPDIDIDAFNTASIVWRSKRFSTTYGVDYCTLSPSHVVGAVKSVATGTFICNNPKVGVDYEGMAHIVFNANYVRSDHENICYSYIYPDGTVTPFVDVASIMGIQFTEPDVQIHGDVILSSFLGDGNGYLIRKSLANYTGMGRFDYVFDAGAEDSSWIDVTSIADIPADTTATMEYRVSNDKVIWSAWQSTGALLVTPAKGRFLHVRLTLTSTDPIYTPTVYDVNARYRPSFIEVQSVAKASTKEPDSAIVIARYEGDVTFQVSRDGGNTFLDAEKDKVVSLLASPSGSELSVRAKITDGSRLDAWGIVW